MDLSSPRLIKLKAALLLLVVVLASTLLLARTPELTSALLLGIALWAACRCYYFLFYVLHHYVDPSFKYRGLWALIRQTLKSKAPNPPG